MGLGALMRAVPANPAIAWEAPEVPANSRQEKKNSHPECCPDRLPGCGKDRARCTKSVWSGGPKQFLPPKPGGTGSPPASPSRQFAGGMDEPPSGILHAKRERPRWLIRPRGSRAVCTWVAPNARGARGGTQSTAFHQDAAGRHVTAGNLPPQRKAVLDTTHPYPGRNEGIAAGGSGNTAGAEGGRSSQTPCQTLSGPDARRHSIPAVPGRLAGGFCFCSPRGTGMAEGNSCRGRQLPGAVLGTSEVLSRTAGGVLGWEEEGRTMILADSDRSRDPPPIRRYLRTRSRKSSACCRRYCRSCHSEQNAAPFSRSSNGSGCPHQRHWERDSLSFASALETGSSSSEDSARSGGATPKRSRRRKASACSDEQKPPWRRDTSAGISLPHQAQRFEALSVTAT